ncbi:MAG: 4Fe-4S binding protein [Phycisphaerales bacterium JB052]
MKTLFKSHDATDQGVPRSVSLPVLDCGSSKAPMMGRTRIARWRAGVLTLVNVLMIAHLIQWAIMGMTVSPIEPSESMETLEVGVVNAGAIFFLVAILATLIFGRFFCGWLCHIVALQDLCAWMMTKVGIRPKAFRSRFLVYFPILLGGYMFVWPTFKRQVLSPLLENAGIDWPNWLRPVEPIQVWSNGLIVDDFWATMPPWYIAVPFLFICGFACVYFLGAKGFCTYGCPYAAFFKPIDTLAPVRIHVNDDCKQCGYCTSVCTSNVRVSEEVRDFGMVVDPGCMKTLDCISACPNDALSLGFGRPALGAKPKASAKESRKAALKKRRGRYDLSLWEETLAAVLMLWFFYATRGMLDAVPMLLAGGLAAISTLIVMLALKLLHQQHVRLYKIQFKAGGSIKPAGYALVLLGLVFVVGSVWSGNARILRWQGDLRYNAATIPTNMLLRPDFNPIGKQRVQAEEAVAAYQRADSPSHGGVGWELNAEHRLRLSYFLSVLDRNDEALEQLRQVISDGEPTEGLVLQAGQLLIRTMDDKQGDTNDQDHEIAKRDAMLALYAQALEEHPNLHAIRTELAKSAYAVGDNDKANAYFEVDGYEDDPLFALSHAGYLSFSGKFDLARAQFEQAAERAEHTENTPGLLIDIGRTALQNGMADVAQEMAQRAVDHKHASVMTWVAAGEIASFSGQFDVGKARIEHAKSMKGYSDQAMLQARAANAILNAQTIEEGRGMLRGAVDIADDPFEAFTIARGMVFAGANLGAPEMLDEGMTIIEGVAESHPEFPVISYDLGDLLYQLGRTTEAYEWVAQAAEADPINAAFAQRAGDLSSVMGDQEQAERWFEEAARRRGD